jgi:cytoskeletal protein RodZ
MAQKIDVQEVEEATKIRAKFLRALENEEYDLLPGQSYVKSFLRTYSEYLGLDPRAMVDLYRASVGPEEEPGHSPVGNEPTGGGRWIVFAVAAILLLLAILFVVGVLGGGN